MSETGEGGFVDEQQHRTLLCNEMDLDHWGCRHLKTNGGGGGVQVVSESAINK